MGRTARARLLLAAVAATLVVCVPALGATTRSLPSVAGGGSLGATPPTPKLTLERVKAIARTSAKLREWRRDHPTSSISGTRDAKTDVWTVSYVGPDRTTHAQVLVSDVTGQITETRTGPQVAWSMARGYDGAFGRSITDPPIWIPLFVLFLAPLVRWRRPISWHTLDLLMLCAFAASLVWFNRGEIFTSVPLAYPPLAYLFVRLTVIGLRGRRRAAPTPESPSDDTDSPSGPNLRSWCPTWFIVTIMLFALGLRFGLNAFDANVIDVGYAGVIGADRIADGRTPYGTFPSDCSQCDTYGPLTYITYVPFEAVAPWTGRWDDLPAAHAAAVTFDVLTLIGLLVLGWRLGGHRLAAGLGVAWSTFPFTAYTLESNSNDSLVAACLTWGLVLAHRPAGRGLMLGLAVAAKFIPAVLLLLWCRHPFPRAEGRRRWPAYLLGLAAAAVLAGWPILLDGVDGVRRFWSRTLGFQFGRESPFSIWGQYTWLRPVQLALAGLVVVLALVAIRRPRTLDLRTFAALSGALMVGVELTLTHWFYLYIPWFLPFALVALVPHWPTARPEPAPVRTVEPAPGPQAQVAPA